MNDRGYIEWEVPHFDPGEVYLDGYFIPTGLQSHQRKSSGSSMFHMKTHKNTSILQKLYFEEAAADLRDGYNVSFMLQVFIDELMAKAKQIESLGTWFYFCPFDRVTETFRATNGQTYKLSRPLAAGIVTGVTSLTHPVVVLLDGTETPSAASVTGQTVTAAADGLIQIDYTPVYKMVAVGGVDFSVNEINEIIAKMDLEEVIEI